MSSKCILFLTWLWVIFGAGTTEDQAIKLPACVAKVGECDDNEGVVCGTDGQTYPTRCHLLRAQCWGQEVSVKYLGSCKGCLEALKYARRQKLRNPNSFVPRCRKDGNYAAVQCMGKNNCWCADSMGRPIKDDQSTRNRRGKPRCRLNSKWRRLALHQMGFKSDTAAAASKGSTEVGTGGAQRTCNKTDRATFNRNLMRIFRKEAVNSGRPQSMPDAAVLDWKFSKLDSNGNQQLDRQELRDLKKIIKRSVKPRRCGRAFGKYCDIFKDDNLSRLEWSTCLANDSINLLNSKTETTSQDTESEPNCWMDKDVALEEQARGGKSRFYVPECMPDGRYQRIQCYSSTPYCWCVNEDTGKSISGTLVKNTRPQCEEEVVVRPMKGCTEPRKTQFLKDLKAFLKTRMLPSGTTFSNASTWKSEDEQIATLSFVYLDQNKNKLWERREWKVFRDLVTSASHLRRCGKKMPRYCDANGDKKISLAEWLNCLESSPRLEKATTAKPAQSNETVASSKLTGLNPVEHYLKD
ncbi:SPARC-related modular calcium-binding protein 2 isoform X2 [Drosophila bipectinata]|uniref:SPARC-related modular calcium-binding protein 2 isoform X2 n=1 Tax=Drosophila bipectinata TaxID=42026 RepID=UPI001C894BE6|nr:SPARC-related modular calcium-binding protein 2 isoform X2 [Drosophila bipectinata]